MPVKTKKIVSALLLAALCSVAAGADIGRSAPEIASATWINSPPRTLAALRGQVVLVEFWTYGCHNCRNVEPYVKQWHERYAGRGLTVIGVHSPEFDHERDLANVRRYVANHDIRYAVAIDNDFAIWNRYRNRYWPTMYLVDKQGVLRYVRIGEGGYGETERRIEQLLAER
jgi:thiol-disulfide isomerase/thioredoxin